MRTTTEPYKPFWQVNSKLSWKSQNTEFYSVISNLFNVKYYDFGTIEQAGQWISVGFCHQLKFK
jgi:iron complex outermembrane receptor protein